MQEADACMWDDDVIDTIDDGGWQTGGGQVTTINKLFIGKHFVSPLNRRSTRNDEEHAI